MFLNIEYIDDFSLTGAVKTKDISVFAVQAVEATKDGKAKVFLSGKEFPLKIKESAQDFKDRCAATVQALMPVVEIEKIVEIEKTEPGNKGNKKATVFEVKEKEEDTEPDETKAPVPGFI